MIRRPPSATRPDTLFPYTTLFRSMFRIFDTAASGMLAQSVRLNTTASNMANADSVASSPDQVYRARQPVFAAIQSALAGDDSARGVRVLGIVESTAPVTVRYDP